MPEWQRLGWWSEEAWVAAGSPNREPSNAEILAGIEGSNAGTSTTEAKPTQANALLLYHAGQVSREQLESWFGKENTTVMLARPISEADQELVANLRGETPAPTNPIASGALGAVNTALERASSTIDTVTNQASRSIPPDTSVAGVVNGIESGVWSPEAAWQYLVLNGLTPEQANAAFTTRGVQPPAQGAPGAQGTGSTATGSTGAGGAPGASGGGAAPQLQGFTPAEMRQRVAQGLATREEALAQYAASLPDNLAPEVRQYRLDNFYASFGPTREQVNATNARNDLNAEIAYASRSPESQFGTSSDAGQREKLIASYTDILGLDPAEAAARADRQVAFGNQGEARVGSEAYRNSPQGRLGAIGHSAVPLDANEQPMAPNNQSGTSTGLQITGGGGDPNIGIMNQGEAYLYANQQTSTNDPFAGVQREQRPDGHYVLINGQWVGPYYSDAVAARAAVQAKRGESSPQRASQWDPYEPANLSVPTVTGRSTAIGRGNYVAGRFASEAPPSGGGGGFAPPGSLNTPPPAQSPNVIYRFNEGGTVTGAGYGEPSNLMIDEEVIGFGAETGKPHFLLNEGPDGLGGQMVPEKLTITPPRPQQTMLGRETQEVQRLENESMRRGLSIHETARLRNLKLLMQEMALV